MRAVSNLTKWMRPGERLGGGWVGEAVAEAREAVGAEGTSVQCIGLGDAVMGLNKLELHNPLTRIKRRHMCVGMQV